jgi:hypothetical protein
MKYSPIQSASLSLYRRFLRLGRALQVDERKSLRDYIRAEFEQCHRTIPKTSISAAEYKLRLGERRYEMMKSSAISGIKIVKV